MEFAPHAYQVSLCLQTLLLAIHAISSTVIPAVARTYAKLALKVFHQTLMEIVVIPVRCQTVLYA